MKQALVGFLREPWREACELQRQHVNSDCRERVDRETICVLLAVALALTAQYYLLINRSWTPRWVQSSAENSEFTRHAYWAIGHLIIYLAVPILIIRLVLKRSPADYGLKLRGAFSCWWVYAVMFAVMLPIIFAVSTRDDFQRTYPFYRLATNEPLWPRFLVWELLYAVQFIALEFFFRGFLLHGTKRRFGPYSIFVMTVPYTMIHFGKPFPETLAAIVAGIVLGFMSLKTRSIWLGAALHIAVAWTMDIAATLR